MSRSRHNCLLYFKECYVKPWKIHYHMAFFNFAKKCQVYYTLTLSDPGYFRQLTIRGGGALKAPPPTISKTILSIFAISYMCILPGVLDMFQLEFLKNSRF